MKRTLLIKLEIDEPNVGFRENGKTMCERLESVLRTNEFLDDPLTVELVHDSRSKMKPEAMIWKAAQDAVQELLKPTYFESLSDILEQVTDKLIALGIEFADQLAYPIIGQPEGRQSVGLKFNGSNRWLSVSWHKMEVTDHFEVIGYVS
ncbi:MAG TPA: hypothetical protein VMK12_07980 [Anaeromyxobacteraceae bacterium]|nr:hypothetical protein [Anaeromyxobacteraceae bacterium]